MSSMKLHLPFYTKNILLKAISLMNEECDLIVQDITDFKQKNINNNNLYKSIGEFIFSYDDNTKLILLGDTGKLVLPTPPSSKIILQHTDVNKASYNRYIKLGYTSMTETNIIKELLDIIKSSSVHTCGFLDKTGKMLKYDVYKLWFESNDLEAVKFEVSNVMEYVFGSSNMNVIQNLKLWDTVTLKNINKHQDHASRLLYADINIPIIMTIYNKEPKLLDGMHRLLKAYTTKKKFIKVILVEKKQLKKALIN